MDFSETIEVKVIDKDDSLAVDAYFFAYFHNLSDALDQIRDVVRTYRSQNFLSERSAPAVVDTTAPRSSASTGPVTSLVDLNSQKATSGFRLSSLFRPFSDTSLLGRPSVSPAADLNGDDYTHIQRKDDASFIPRTSSPKSATLISFPRQGTDSTTSSRQTTQSLPVPDYTYPPSTSSSTIYPNASSLNRDGIGSWGLGVPAWLKSPRKPFSGTPVTPESQTILDSNPVKEVYSSASSPGPMPVSRSSGGDLAFSVLETPDMAAEPEIIEKFRTAFAYDAKETLLGCRCLPLHLKATNDPCCRFSGIHI